MTDPTRIQLAPGFLPAGTRLSGIYEIDAPLAQGGMGEVYRGRAIETGDAVAIKVVRADMARDEAVLALFRREASALGRLHHEAIVRYFVFTLDPALQRHYLAMELVEGVSLSELLERGPLGADEACRLLRRVALGLQAAQERGVVPRAVSPDNIIIEDGDVGHARIIDFGIARSTRLGDATVIGSGFAGKYNYVSPEQLGLAGGEVTGRSDIYSLGLVIVQCLRGKPIDMGGSQADIVDKRRRLPDLSDVDPRLRGLLERMLQPHPQDRPATMAEVAACASPAPAPSVRPPSEDPAPAPRYRAASPSSVSRKPPRVRRRWPWAAAAGALAVLAVGGLVVFQASDPWTFPTPPPAPTLGSPDVGAPPVGSDDVRRIADFIRDYDGGRCFLALPTALTASSADIEAFARDERPFHDLDRAFKAANGFEAAIEGGQVAAGQCAALGFIQELRRKAGAEVARLSIARTRVSQGGLLEGRLAGGPAHVALLVVDDAGGVSDVTDRLVGEADRSFSMQLSRESGKGASPMLLVSLGGTQPVSGLDSALQATRDGPAASDGKAAQAPPGRIEVGVKYFKLD
jgi:serine/threonine-protein kinase